jgi:predicted anti-sigma-YlaC factor YlaD
MRPVSGLGCSAYREAISATLDGEDAGVSTERVDRHLSSCPECACFEESARRLAGEVRRAGSNGSGYQQESFDAVPVVMRALGAERRRARLRTLSPLARWGVSAALGVALPLLALDTGGSPRHLAPTHVATPCMRGVGGQGAVLALHDGTRWPPVRPPAGRRPHQRS